MVLTNRTNATCMFLAIRKGYTAKKLYKKFETYCIPRNETMRPRSQFPHSYFCKRLIYSRDRSFYFAAENRSQMHACGNWERGCTVFYLGIHKSDLICSVLWIPIYNYSYRKFIYVSILNQRR